MVGLDTRRFDGCVEADGLDADVLEEGGAERGLGPWGPSSGWSGCPAR
ncbi:MAG: hypothetical protein WKF86_08300 [Acidimicrobiales bacterium]